MGMLRISGKLNLGQFWPKGAVGRNLGSDAGTVKVVVDKEEPSRLYRDVGGKRKEVTSF